MKRLFTLMLVGVLVIGAGAVALGETQVGTGIPATATINVSVSWSVLNWIVLYIPNGDMSVTLATDVDGSYYHPDTDRWDPVTDGVDHNAYVITNGTSGYELTVSAVSSGTIQAALDRFQIQGGDLGTTWTSMGTDPTTPVTVSLKTNTGAAIDHINNIRYQYLINETDAPGGYAVTVTYTATAP